MPSVYFSARIRYNPVRMYYTLVKLLNRKFKNCLAIIFAARRGKISNSFIGDLKRLAH
jgi:hypothetical protein